MCEIDTGNIGRYFNFAMTICGGFYYHVGMNTISI